MTTLSNEILENYQVRKTKQQKDAFISLLKSHHRDLQIQEGGLIKSRNIIIGNVDQSKIILSAHYDTCSRLPFPNFITPKNPIIYLLYTIAILIPVFLLLLVFSILLQYLIENFWINYISNLVLYFVICGLMLAGPPNKHNANDNTSGIITVFEMYNRLTPEEKQIVSIVLFDNEESGLLGSRLFKKIYKGQLNSKLLINFDCVSDGDYILFAASKSARENWSPEKYFIPNDGKIPLNEKLEQVLYPSDQQGFPNAIAVAALKKAKIIGYYMNRIHTSKDTVFDITNINYITHKTHDLISAAIIKTECR